MNVEAEIVGIKKDIEYLKTEHQQFKEFMKKFEAVPYQINSIDEKMGTLLERVKAVEEEPKADSSTGMGFDKAADWIKYALLIGSVIATILAGFFGIDVSNFIGGS